MRDGEGLGAQQPEPGIHQTVDAGNASPVDPSNLIAPGTSPTYPHPL